MISGVHCSHTSTCTVHVLVSRLEQSVRGRAPRSYIIEQARLLRQKTENRYLGVLAASWGVNRRRKALFGVISRPGTPTAVFAGETVELW